MLDAITTTQQAMHLDQMRLQLISHNISNMQTPAYKKQFLETVDYLSKTRELSLPTTIVSHSQGSLVSSNSKLDLAIKGPGFFQIQTENGIFYTRRGDCQINLAGQLTTTNGYLLLGKNGPIQVDNQNFTIDSQGRVYDINHTLIDELAVIDFKNLTELRYQPPGLFKASPAAEGYSVSSQIFQGFTEQANVQSSEEMSELLSLVRHFESSQKLMQASDNLLAHAINHLGEING